MIPPPCRTVQAQATGPGSRVLRVGVLVVPLCLTACLPHVTPDGGTPGCSVVDEAYSRDGFQNGDVFRICFDREGNVYPDPGVQPIDDKELARQGYFVPECVRAAGGSYNPQEISHAFAQRINRYCRQDTATCRTLVVLIHGMTSSYPESKRSYKLARRVIRDRNVWGSFAFLEVYWDGLYGSALGAWGPARGGSRFVGLGLRPVLAKIDTKVPLRVVTHSLGAAVICSALWNVVLGETSSLDSEFRARQRSLPIPAHPNVRVGLVAAAIPEHEFDSYEGRTHNVDRVVLAVNEDDEALLKSPLGPTWFGSTRLGCSLEAAEYAQKRMDGSGTALYSINFSGSLDHSFKDYLLRRQFEEAFLDLLLEPQTEIKARSGGAQSKALVSGVAGIR